MTEDETVEDIVYLRQLGYTREEIATDLGVEFSEVRNLIRKHKIGKGIRQTSKIQASQGASLPAKYERTILEQAIDILGDKLRETRDGYFIGRCPVSTETIIKEAGLVFDNDKA